MPQAAFSAPALRFVCWQLDWAGLTACLPPVANFESAGAFVAWPQLLHGVVAPFRQVHGFLRGNVEYARWGLVLQLPKTV